MIVTWRNIYPDGFATHGTAESARFHHLDDLIRVEQRWNGQRLLPPVGMQRASHEWRFHAALLKYTLQKRLTAEDRQRILEANQAAYHGDIDGDLEGAI
jgi:hypothetical protein